MILVIAQLP